MRLALTLCALGIAAGPVSAAAKKTTSKATAAKRARAAQMRERGLSAVAAGREDEALEDVAAGRLVRVLEDWCPPLAGWFLYHPSRRQTPPALAALIAALRLRRDRR